MACGPGVDASAGGKGPLCAEHALEIYKEAFNRAWSQHADPDGQSGEAGREETAHRVAWRAVERTNKKGADDRWEKLD